MPYKVLHGSHTAYPYVTDNISIKLLSDPPGPVCLKFGPVLSIIVVFRLLFYFQDVIFPPLMYTFMMADMLLTYPKSFAVSAPEAEAKCAPTVMPLWETLRSNIAVSLRETGA